MALSSDLISQLVKTTKSDKQKKTESTSYGTTVKYEGRTYVKLDGSDLLTPVNTTAVTEDGERVTVLIKDHVATITGNISSPAARNDTVQEIADEITEVEILVADKVSTKQLEAETARIDTLVSENVVIRETLTANEADIRDLTADTVEITGKLTATEAEIEALSTTKLDATVADITYATIESLNATNADVYNLNATYASITGKLNAVDADIDKLYADKLNAADADLMYATIAELNAAHAEINTLEAGVADINTLIFGTATGSTIHTNFANAVIAQLGNAQIKSAMIESVSASKITAGDILTNNIRVMSDDGKLLISDETIQISDGTRVRVQIGKDAANDYSINIWDTDGNLMFSEGGITDSAIKEAIIRNDMVASDANIAASKLDISSLFTEINNSTQTIKSNRILLDADNQTLDVAFESLSSDVESIDGKVTSQGTQLSVVQGKIDSKVWQQDIDNATNELSSQYSTLEQNLNGISVTVGEHTSQIEDIDSRVEQAQSTANQNAADMTQIVTDFNKDIESLQTQIDGSITTWFYEVAPTNSNEPAKNWNTTDLKNTHLGDLYYDTITGYCYRWQVKNNAYSWQRITDTDVTKALSDAAAAQDTADQKRRVFYSQPTVPYEAGDLWVQGSGGDILRCQTPKTSSQSYSQTDWVLASKYTDDTLAATAKNTADSAVSRVATAETRIDQNKQLIELRATKSEVTETLKGYYTKDQTDAAIQVKSDEIVSTVRAETVVRPTISGQKTQTVIVQNALQNSIAGLTLYGKTTQNGTPSPTTPVALESVGDDGNVTVNVNAQTMTISTPNGLPGVPVPSDGNYTDTSGQQWICDEIDFARGKYIKRVTKLTLAGSAFNLAENDGYPVGGSVMFYGILSDVKSGFKYALCNKLPCNTGALKNDITGFYGSGARAYCRIQGVSDLTTFRSLMDGAEFIYVLATPVEKDLTAEQIATFNALGNPAGTFTVTSEACLSIELSGIASSNEVDNLASRMTNAETSITQNSEAIALRATKTEVAQTLGGYYTKEETEAAITLKSNEITSTVRQEIAAVEIGGRNLFENSSFAFDADGWDTTSFAITSKEGKQCGQVIGTLGTGGLGVRQDLLDKIEPNADYTLSGWFYSDDIVQGATSPAFWFFGQYTDANNTYYNYGINHLPINTGKWEYVTFTFTTDDGVKNATRYSFYVYTRDYTGSLYFRELKLEKGNKATDWTPAPEDVDADITNVQNTANSNADRIEIVTTTIQQLADSISSLVRDGNGGSLIQQDSSGLWYFNIGGLEQTLSNTANGLDNLQGVVLDANGQIDVLKSTALALQQRTEYVRSYTDSNGQPCLELGEGDSVFKVRITNTEIQFAEGTDVPAKLNRKMLVIEKAMVKNELQFGDDQVVDGVWILKRRSNGNLGLSWKVVGN